MSDVGNTLPPSPPLPPATPPPPPPYGAPPPPPSSTTIDFARPFTFVFEDPNWLTKILIGGLFTLAVVVLVGYFFVLGYIARMVRNVIAGVERPLPEWDDLGEYFSEGARLFGVGMVYALPILIIVGAVYVPAIVLSGMHSDAVRGVGGGMLGCGWCIIFPLEIALGLWMPAAMLFATVDQRFGAGFEFARIWAFLRANVTNYLLAIVVYLVASFLAQFGIILLCIGVIFTLFWAYVVGAYAFAQTYRLSPVK